MSFTVLDPQAVSATVASLQARIRARFPNRQLGLVAEELHAASMRAGDISARRKSSRVLRFVCFGFATLVALVALTALVVLVRDAIATGGRKSFEWLGVVESGVNDAVFAAIAVAFLVSASGRLDRRATLRDLYALRSLAHVIDMHQLTKDPERLLSQPSDTEASVKSDLSAKDLGRYLDYCSELLSLVSKTAAIYAQATTDPVVLDTVSEIESLTNGLSRKIWQKIAILHT